MRYALNNRPDVRYHPRFLPRVAPWLARYWWHSAPSRLARAARAMLPLIERSVAEHDALKDEAGIAGLFRRTGWIDGARSQAGLDQAAAEAASLSSHGLKHQVLDRQALTALEPALSERMVGGVHWLDPVNVSDPGAVTRGYAAPAAAARRGVRERRRAQPAAGWRRLAGGHRRRPAAGARAVVALGPGPPMCSGRWAIACRWRSSAAITSISRWNGARR